MERISRDRSCSSSPSLYLIYVVQIGVIRLSYDRYAINFYISTIFDVLLSIIVGYFLMGAWVSNGKKL